MKKNKTTFPPFKKWLILIIGYTIIHASISIFSDISTSSIGMHIGIAIGGFVLITYDK